MRRTLAPLFSPAFFLGNHPGASFVFYNQSAAVNFPNQEFAALLEAAADFVDYRSGQYFVKRDFKLAAGGNALRLRDPARLPPWAIDLRRMFDALADLEFSSRKGSPLEKLCEAGTFFGLQELESETAGKLLALVSQKAKRCLSQDLQRILERATRPCLELERKSYSLALAAIGLSETTTDSNRRFLGERPSERLFVMFRRFPVLARLWLQLISQWRDQIAELLARLVADRTALSRAFLGSQPAGPIVAMRCGLSDPHNCGRTVMLLQFAAGSVIYKPRTGDGEWEWFSFLQGMNAQSFQPKLKAAHVLRRKGYCWMECIESSSCRDAAAARRFYRRMGGIVGAAHLLRAADCHRDNVIAVGEYPILVDAEALWHAGPAAKAQTHVDLLYRTGFLPGSNRRSLQSRSSVLGGAITGSHLPRIHDKALRAAQYEREIVDGFRRAWRCVLGTRNQRAAFVRRLGRICSRKRRRIYWPTEKYAAIIRASVQPGTLRLGVERDLMFSRLCSRRTVTPSVIHAEITAMKRLDIPYFTSGTNARFLLDTLSAPPAELTSALRSALK